jgi:cytochrome d ubiquinol oxidase subunit II
MEFLGLAPAVWLPVVFAGLMGLAILFYVILDGYDLGVGILLGGAEDEGERDSMIASIGPFWDANETWLVLATGLLLVAFPRAHGVILGELYLPVMLMLVGLILRGVAFKFRTKMTPGSKLSWDRAFLGGSLLAALAQGWMLGSYILGFEDSWAAHLFAAVTALGLASAYAFIGACWLASRRKGHSSAARPCGRAPRSCSQGSGWRRCRWGPLSCPSASSTGGSPCRTWSCWRRSRW